MIVTSGCPFSYIITNHSGKVIKEYDNRKGKYPCTANRVTFEAPAKKTSLLSFYPKEYNGLRFNLPKGVYTLKLYINSGQPIPVTPSKMIIR